VRYGWWSLAFLGLGTTFFLLGSRLTLKGKTSILALLVREYGRTLRRGGVVLAILGAIFALYALLGFA